MNSELTLPFFHSCALLQVPPDLRKKKDLLYCKDRFKHKDSRRKKMKKRGKQESLHNNKLKKKLGLSDYSKNKRRKKERQKLNDKCWKGKNK